MSDQKWYHLRLWSGMTLRGWLRLLARNRFAIHPRRWPLAAATTLFAASNSCLALCQKMWLGRKINRVPAPADPVFIVGHWRSGTTMLHELFALDPRFRCPTTYECLSPNHFLLTESLFRRLFWFLLPRKRPMDNMKMSFDRPQEDEAALCMLGVPSPFLTVAFPNHPVPYPDYVTLEPLSDRARKRWQATWTRFMRMLILKQPGRLVLKSPQHTFRLPMLLELFPQARFIHLSRDPWEIFPSTLHFWQKMYETQGLQIPNTAGREQFVLETFVAMQRRVDEFKAVVPDHQFYEVRYEQLVQDPVAEMKSIYDALGCDHFAEVQDALAGYAKRSGRYRTNQYQLTDEQKALIQEHWQDYLE